MKTVFGLDVRMVVVSFPLGKWLVKALDTYFEEPKQGRCLKEACLEVPILRWQGMGVPTVYGNVLGVLVLFHLVEDLPEDSSSA